MNETPFMDYSLYSKDRIKYIQLKLRININIPFNTSISNNNQRKKVKYHI